MTTIQPIGSYFDIDSEGYIVNPSNLAKLPSKWRTALDDMIQAYLKNLGKENIVSIVVRGSVARGEPVDNVSDIDTMAIVHNAQLHSHDWMKEVCVQLRETYPFITGFELILWDVDRVRNLQSKNMRFMLKTQSAIVWGEDVIAGIEKIKPNSETAKSLLKHFPDSMKQAKVNLDKVSDEEDVKEICQWVAKRILRAGFYFVMPRANTFTKDLYPSYETFVRYYPEKGAGMKQALEYAIEPTGNKDEVALLINDFGEWFSEVVEKLEEIQNPTSID